MKRMLGLAALWVAVLLLVISAAGAYWVFTSLPDADATMAAAGLEEDVDIVRDARGVPHIYAASARDATLALGFVHAQDRLWQMEMMRRLGAGRLAEVLGPRALPSDRFMRVLGLNHLVEKQYAGLDPEVRQALEAYAAGVNAWLNGHEGALPPEFLFLRYPPEPWRPADSLLWARIMALRLGGNRRDEILRARLAARLTPERIAEMWPPYPAEGPVTAGELAELYKGLPVDGLAGLEPAGMPRGASNSWAVAGTRTASGKPILANDPHLGFGAPVMWYLARIVAPGLEVAGATAPGVPFMMLGHNRRIAWGMTGTHSDLQDLFIERLDAEDGGRYMTPDGYRPLATRNEVIRVRGAGDVVLKVRETRHGPVISDAPGGSRGVTDEGEVLALAATALGENDRTVQALHRLNRAGDWEAFVAAMKDFHAPQMNVVYADADGNIGFYAAGRVPIRRSGRGRVPSRGWTGEGDWLGFVPFAELPRALNPGGGRIVTANNKVVSAGYPHFITDDWAPPYRAQRILELLDGGGSPQSPDTTADIQRDHASPMARHLLPLMLDIEPGGGRERRVLALMRDWDGVMARHRPEPLIFSTWLRELNRAVYADELGKLFPDFWGFRPRFIAFVLTRRREWCDDVRTPPVEDCKSRVTAALEAALDQLTERFGDRFEGWRWGDMHRAWFRHPIFTGMPVIGGLADLVIATDGGNFTVNRGASRVADPEHPFAHIHGPGFRAIYDLSDLAQSRFMIATGQSGNPLSPHYGDLLRDWRDGRYMRLGLKRGDLESGAEGVLRLVPPAPPATQ